MSRPNWDEYFLNLLPGLGSRVSCNRGKCASIFVKDNRILATGYAGAPPHLNHCLDYDDQLEESCRFLPKDPNELITVVRQGKNTLKLNPEEIQTIVIEGVEYTWNSEKQRYQSKVKISCKRSSHAESNGILSAAKFGVSLEGSTLYVSMTCCSDCARAIIGVGVVRVVASKCYHSSQEAEFLLASAGIPLEIIDNSVVEYVNQKGL